MEIFSIAASKASAGRVSVPALFINFSFAVYNKRARKIVLEKRKHKKCFNLEMEAAIALAVPLGAACDVMELEFSGLAAIELRFFYGDTLIRLFIMCDDRTESTHTPTIVCQRLSRDDSQLQRN